MRRRSEPDWDARYRDPDREPSAEPSPFLLAVEDRFPPPPARVLDLAAGAGRHAVHLAARGFSVLAVDRSEAGLAIARRRAAERGVDIETLAADLTAWRLPEAKFGVVLDFLYLERPLFGAIERALVPGGVLVFETFTVDRTDGPGRRAFLLESGELATAFPGLETLVYEERDGMARLLARRP